MRTERRRSWSAVQIEWTISWLLPHGLCFKFRHLHAETSVRSTQYGEQSYGREMRHWSNGAVAGIRGILRRLPHHVRLEAHVKKKLIVVGALVVAGGALAGILFAVFPVQMTTYGGMARNYLLTLSMPAGTVSTETNPAYQSVASAASAPPPADAPWPNAAVGDWPSYNRTPSSQRYSPLNEINAKNVAQLKVLCTYDVHEFTSFESSLIMVDNALIGTTEFDIFSINPATCAENWRTHLVYPGALLPPIGAPLTWTACCFAARRTPGCWPLISRRASSCGRRESRTEAWRVGALGADCLGRPRLHRQFGWRLQGR